MTAPQRGHPHEWLPRARGDESDVYADEVLQLFPTVDGGELQQRRRTGISGKQ